MITSSWSGSDLDLTIRVQVPAQVDTDGQAVVPAKLFDGLTTRLKAGVVTFEVEGDDARIAAGSAKASVRLLPADEFPRVGEPGRLRGHRRRRAVRRSTASGDPRRIA